MLRGQNIEFVVQLYTHSLKRSKSIWHIPREANQCADGPAKLGALQREQLVKLLVPPDEVIEDMIEDIQEAEAGAASSSSSNS